MRRGAAPRPARDRGARGARDHRPGLVLFDTWAYGAHLLPEPYDDRRLGWADVWYRAQPGASPYANPVTGLHFIVDLNRMELLEVEDEHRVDEPRTMGEYVPRLVPGLRQRDDLQAARGHAARGRVVHARGQRAALAEVVAAGRLQPPRGAGAAHRGLRGRRPRPPRRAPALVRRDGRALPRPDARALPAHRVRHRRVGPRVHDHVARARAATASARSPTSTRSCTTPAASRTRSGTRSASTRRTTRSCGSTSTPWPAPRCGARAGSSSPST